ncbi:MAG: hypothetical protein ACLSX2_08770 [Christensenellaceae bacterium]
MERQRIAQALAAHGFREGGNVFYGVVDGYPVMAALLGKEQIYAVTATFTVRQLPAGAQRKALLKALKAQAAVNQAQGRTAALTWQEKKGYRLEEVVELLQAAAGTLKAHGVEEPEDRCPICGQGECDGYIRYDGRYEVIHQRCISGMKAEAQQQAAANQGSYVLGIVGALVGGLVGIIPTVLSIWLLERIWSLLYALIPLGAYYGYKLCGGKMNRAALATSIIVSILDVYVLQLVLLVIGLIVEYQCSMLESLQLLRSVIGDGEFWVSLTTNAWDSFLFLALGIWIAWSQISRTHKSDLKGIQDVMATMTLKEGVQPLEQEEDAAQQQSLEG